MYFEKQLNNTPRLTYYRKNLRKSMTPAEATLWRFLKSKQMKGIRFRRQFSVRNYILDFYCPKYKVVIELDGAGHFTEEGMKADKERDNYLNSVGILVLRFENELVFKRTETVLEIILETVKKLNQDDSMV